MRLEVLADPGIRIVLCLTTSLPLFTAISYLTAVTTVTPQLMLPLVGELAPPHRRASALSVVVSGLIGGILVARILSGVVTNYTSWRNIYWIAFGLQYTIFGLLWLFMPNYPRTNLESLNYFKLLYSILKLPPKNPVLVYAMGIGFFSSAVFTSYWTTLTFLLAGEPYDYSPLVIGLFGLIGIAAMIITPPYARLVIDRFVPQFGTINGTLMSLAGSVLGTYLGGAPVYSVAGPVIQAFLLDFGMQSAQISNRAAIYGIEPTKRNRVNTCYMMATFTGQLMGTSVGANIYARRGWIASGSASVGFISAALLLCLIRGPWEKGWIGWRGGWSIKKKPGVDMGTGAGKPPVKDEEHADGRDGRSGGEEEKSYEENDQKTKTQTERGQEVPTQTPGSSNDSNAGMTNRANNETAK